jgi:hypothetical protein
MPALAVEAVVVALAEQAVVAGSAPEGVVAGASAHEGWRFVVEELRAIGADVHLAEPAETAARRGNKKRAKTDRADARHQRELLMIGRLPESWIPPEHLLDLRARVRLRHTLVDQRGEWQQRIQAVLYHHGSPQRAGLLTGENRAWLENLELPAGAREQVTVALEMIDALDAQSQGWCKRRSDGRALSVVPATVALMIVGSFHGVDERRRQRWPVPTGWRSRRSSGRCCAMSTPM